MLKLLGVLIGTEDYKTRTKSAWKSSLVGLSSSILIRFHENILLFYSILQKKGKTVFSDDQLFVMYFYRKKHVWKRIMNTESLSYFKIACHT